MDIYVLQIVVGSFDWEKYFLMSSTHVDDKVH